MDKERIEPGEFKAVDPWAHRSEGMSCETCMWFVIKETETRHVIKSTKSLGRCRKHAPTLQGYPAVFGDDWCGDHKLDENKIESRTLVQNYQEKVKVVREYNLDHVTPGPPPADYKDPYIPGGTGKSPMPDMPSTSRDTPTAHQL